MALLKPTSMIFVQARRSFQKNASENPLQSRIRSAETFSSPSQWISKFVACLRRSIGTWLTLIFGHPHSCKFLRKVECLMRSHCHMIWILAVFLATQLKSYNQLFGEHDTPIFRASPCISGLNHVLVDVSSVLVDFTSLRLCVGTVRRLDCLC